MSQFIRVGSHRVDAGMTLFYSAFHIYVQKFRSAYLRIDLIHRILRFFCFRIEFWDLGFIWDLGFEIWDLTNFVLEKILPIYQSEFCKSLLGRNTIHCRAVTDVSLFFPPGLCGLDATVWRPYF